MDKKSGDKTIELYFPNQIQAYITPIVTLVMAIFVSFTIYISLNNPSFINASSSKNTRQDVNIDNLDSFTLGQIKGTYESFTEYDNETCTEDGKPVVVMISATWCPHCQYIGETFNDWAKEQKDVSVYRYEVDTGDNPLTDELETEVPDDIMSLYTTFNPSQSIPTFIYGCKYGRIGNGFEGDSDGLEKEVAAFDSIVEQLL
jgi:thiol-disulfide isomerase/thioredoxin